jgi:hypothetical protein
LKHWGIFLTSRADLRSLRNHFRRFLMVLDPDGRKLYFRYYDPRVLRVYLPTCNAEEREIVYGDVVEGYWCEDERGKRMESFRGGG